MQKFSFLEHTADIKFQAFGKTREEVFENCALALSNALYDGKIKEKKTYKIKTQGDDNESLLYNFLEELLFLFDTENFLLSSVKEIKIKDNKITAKLIGDNSEKYEIKTYIKAVTYNDMFIKKEKNKFTAQVVLDV